MHLSCAVEGQPGPLSQGGVGQARLPASLYLHLPFLIGRDSWETVVNYKSKNWIDKREGGERGETEDHLGRVNLVFTLRG